jgi:hypothetical protein
MSGTKYSLAGLVAAVLGLGTAAAQTPYMMPATPTSPTPPTPAMTGGAVTNGQGSGQLTPSRWILHEAPNGCCGPVGCDGPIFCEFYLGSGVTFPIGGGTFNGTLADGWVVEGGARTLFFDRPAERAWVVDLGVRNTFQNVNDRGQHFNLFQVESQVINPMAIDVTTACRDLNRTTFNVGIGRDWYLWGCAYDDYNWRIGVDAGGRYGTEKVNFTGTFVQTTLASTTIPSRSDAIASAFVAVHSELEWCCGRCWFQLGVRGEYNYTWSDILQAQNLSNLQELTVLIQLGARF